MKLYIGNQKYSSWSFRPWIALTVKGVAFEQVLCRFDDHPERVDFRTFSPTGKVPMLDNDGVKVWESLAILEYLADLHPQKAFWPEDIARRAHARAANHAARGNGQIPARRRRVTHQSPEIPAPIVVSRRPREPSSRAGARKRLNDVLQKLPPSRSDVRDGRRRRRALALDHGHD